MGFKMDFILAWSKFWLCLRRLWDSEYNWELCLEFSLCFWVGILGLKLLFGEQEKLPRGSFTDEFIDLSLDVFFL